MTAAVEQPVLPRFIQKSPSRHAELRYRKVMHLQSVRSRDLFREKKSAISSRNVMTLVQAVYPLQSESLQTGLQIDLDKVPKKYAGLDGTEIAISESQERMAVVVDPKDVDTFLGYANEENLEAIPVAVVTEIHVWYLYGEEKKS